MSIASGAIAVGIRDARVEIMDGSWILVYSKEVAEEEDEELPGMVVVVVGMQMLAPETENMPNTVATRAKSSFDNGAATPNELELNENFTRDPIDQIPPAAAHSKQEIAQN